MSLFRCEPFGTDAILYRRFALPEADELLAAVAAVGQISPFRHMQTPGGFTMSVALTNCGTYGWTTDRRGYRYTREDPETGQSWPAMPGVFCRLACSAARTAGYDDFEPDACLVNRYIPGARLTLHQDRNEADFAHPIVSISLGMTAIFQFGGLTRSAHCAKLALHHGDVAVWGRADRLRYHGVMPLKGPAHPSVGEQRINLTFRKAG